MECLVPRRVVFWEFLLVPKIPHFFLQTLLWGDYVRSGGGADMAIRRHLVHVVRVRGVT